MEHNKIFISYAKEDINYAEKLYNFLLSKNYDPWLDKKKLLVGQDWQFFIQDALQKADFIILLLSKTSVSKRGFVQKEFRKALEYCEYKLDSDIYVIPIKIDDCDVPMNLQKFQWLEYHNNAFEQITKAIEVQQKVLLKAPNTLELGEGIIQISDTVRQGILGEVSPKHIYEFHYPQFNLSEDESQNDLNTLINHDVLNNILAARNNFHEYLLNDGKRGALDPDNPEDSTSYGKIEIKMLSPFFVSITSFTSEYYTGTPHGMFGTIGLNYFNNPIRSFQFIELFDDKSNYLLKIRDLIHEKLMLIAEKEDMYYSIEDGSSDEILEMSYEDKRNSFYVYDDGLEAKKENFNNYFFKKNALVFIYNPYDITAWSHGDHFPEISFDELLKTFPNEPKLHDFISKLKNN